MTSNRLLQLREELGMSQADVCRASSINSFSYSKLERGVESPLDYKGEWSTYAKRLSDFHGLSPSYLFPSHAAPREVSLDPSYVPKLLASKGYFFNCTEDHAVYEDLREQCRRALSTLTPREEFVLRRRFGVAEDTLKDIGSDIKVNTERVRQIEAEALRKLRHPSRSKRLVPFVRYSGTNTPNHLHYITTSVTRHTVATDREIVHMSKKNHWTPEDKELLLKLADEGQSLDYIAKLLKRTRGAVQQKLSKLRDRSIEEKVTRKISNSAEMVITFPGGKVFKKKLSIKDADSIILDMVKQ